MSVLFQSIAQLLLGLVIAGTFMLMLYGTSRVRAWNVVRIERARRYRERTRYVGRHTRQRTVRSWS